MDNIRAMWDKIKMNCVRHENLFHITCTISFVVMEFLDANPNYDMNNEWKKCYYFALWNADQPTN